MFFDSIYGCRYASAQQVMTDFKDSCMDVSYSEMVDQMRNASLKGPVGGGSRQWVFQTCTEFGMRRQKLNRTFFSLSPSSVFSALSLSSSSLYVLVTHTHTHTHTPTSCITIC